MIGDAINVSQSTTNFPKGVICETAGTFKDIQRSTQNMTIIIISALLLIIIILTLQFHSLSVVCMILFSISVSLAGGFIGIWLFGIMSSSEIPVISDILSRFAGNSNEINLATWVGFLALLGIAADDGILMATYLKQQFKQDVPNTVGAHKRIILAAKRRIRPALITTATTVIALLPVLTNTGKGSELLVPMAIPVFSGMLFSFCTVLIIPVLWEGRREVRRQK